MACNPVVSEGEITFESVGVIATRPGNKEEEGSPFIWGLDEALLDQRKRPSDCRHLEQRHVYLRQG